MANPFVHVELNTTDSRKARGFYGQLFDWKLEIMEPTGAMLGLWQNAAAPAR